MAKSKQKTDKQKTGPSNEIRPNTTVAPVIFAFLEKKGLYIVAGVLFVMLLVLFSQFIFGDRVLLFKDAGSDTIGGHWPIYYNYAHYFKTEGIPKWSFAQGLGTNVFPGSMGDLLGDTVFLVKPENMPYAFAYIQMMKLFFAGIFFALFLRKKGFSYYVALIGAAIYAFTGFITIGSTWFVFTTEAMDLALLFYGLELLRQDNNPLVFPVAVALIIGFNPVYLYLDVLLVTAYLAISFLYKGFDKSDFKFLGKAFLLGVLGVGIATVLVVGNLDQIKESPRGSGLTSHEKFLRSYPVFVRAQNQFYETFVLRMLGNDMAGYCGNVNDGTFKGWNNWFEAPIQYCSLLVLLLLPQLFVLARSRLKILAALALLLAVLAVIFPYFRIAFWLFSGDYFRTFSLFFCVLEILLALKALELIIKQGKVNLPLLLATYALLVAALFGISMANDEVQIQVLIFLTIEAILLWVISYPAFRRAAMIALLPVLFIELIVMSWGTFYTRETLTKSELKTKTGYNDHTVDALAYIRSIDHGFYRVHKNYQSGPMHLKSLNDALIQGFYSSQSYHSFNNVYYARFLQKTQVISEHDIPGSSAEDQTRWIYGLGAHPILMQLVGGKYQLCEGAPKWLSTFWYDSIASFDSMKVLKNKYPLPLGFTYDRYITESEMSHISYIHKDMTLINAVVLDTSLISDDLHGLKRFWARDTLAMDTISPVNIVGIFSKIQSDSFHISRFEQSHIEGDIKVDSKKILFFSIPYSAGWTMKIDGRDVKPLMVNFGFLGCILDTGAHKIELNFEPPYYTAGIRVSAISLLILAGLAIAAFLMRMRKKEVTS